ncbi:HTH domain-containing protein [bacterium]|nr:MAG: HTH domain-containing protein [bacterium]
MARGNQIARQWAVIKTLDGRPQGITIAELSRDLNCSPRTIYRDLDDLQNSGFPIFNDLVDGVGRWQFVDGYRTSLPTPFSSFLKNSQIGEFLL